VEAGAPEGADSPAEGVRNVLTEYNS